MAEKPSEEGYISVVDEEPELMELLKWDQPQTQKAQEAEPPPTKGKAKSQESKKKSKEKESEKDPFELPDPTFIENYRLSKDLARSLIEELKPVMPECTKTADSVESKILAALSFLASGKYQKIVGSPKADPAISQYFVTTSVVQVCQAMNHPTIVKKYIHFPHLREERDVIKARFYMKYGIPHVVGCIDCMHVPIIKPEEDQKVHFNKSYHSKKVQVICDSDHTIISVDPSPGSLTHDAVLNKHAVKNDLESLRAANEQCWLIGGPYYTNKPYVMTPVPKIMKKSQLSPEKYYNTVQAQTHAVVTETIKHLKCRWKCLQATQSRQFDHTEMSMMIVSCCILHNICNQRGLTITPMTPAEERLEIMKQKVANGPVSKKLNDDEEGNRVRAELVQRVWSERRELPEPLTPKKRGKKDAKAFAVPAPVHQPSVPSSMSMGMQLQQSMTQSQAQSQQNLPDDMSKRPRLAMNPPPLPASAPAPPYSLMPAWGHYQHTTHTHTHSAHNTHNAHHH